jgi:hypothetical protein
VAIEAADLISLVDLELSACSWHCMFPVFKKSSLITKLVISDLVVTPNGLRISAGDGRSRPSNVLRSFRDTWTILHLCREAIAASILSHSHHNCLFWGACCKILKKDMI